MKSPLRYSSLFVLFFCLLLVFAARGQTPIGKPFITNYDPSVYKAHVQIFSAGQDSRGIFYIGNGDGLLEFDGDNWRLIPLPKSTSPFSIKAAPDGKTYIGAEDQIGHLVYDQTGKAGFYSLLPLMPDSVGHFSRVNQIYPFEDKVIFQAEINYVFILQDGKIHPLPYSGRLRSFLLGKDLYFWDAQRGMTQIVDNEWKVVENAFFLEHSPEFIIPEGKDKALILTSSPEEGLHLYRVSREYFLRQTPIRVDQEFPELLALLNKINYRKGRRSKTVRLPSGEIAILSLASTLYILDEKGRLKQKVNQETGIASPTILSFDSDDQGNFLLGTNNGASYVEVTSPLSFWDEKSGLVGVVEALTSYQGKIYVGTHQGLYELDGDRARRVENGISLRRQLWSLYNFTPQETAGKEQVLLAHIDGVYGLQDGRVDLIFKTDPRTTVFEFYRSKRDPNRVFLMYYDGFGSMRYEGGEWIDEGKIPDLQDEFRSMAEDENGDLWASTFRNGVVRIPYFEDPTAVSKDNLRYYTLDDGFGSLKNIITYEVDGQPVFATEQGFYAYQPEADSMAPFEPFRGTRLSDGKHDIFAFLKAPDGAFWASGLQSAASPVGVLKPDESGGYSFDDKDFKLIPNTMVLAHYLAPDSSVWFGGSKGLFRYKASERKPNFNPRKLFIRQVQAGKDSLLHPEKNAVLPYDLNSIVIRFTLPDFGSGQNLYRYRLKGYTEGWSKWTSDTKAAYTNLNEGDYTFEVQAKNRYGNLSEVSTYAFRVLPPWYREWWAYLGYLIAAFLGVWGLIRFNTRRLEREKEKLEGIVKERTAEIQTQKEEIQAQADNLLEANTEIRQQKEELETQAEQLQEVNHALERSHQSLQTLAELGQQINQDLSVEKILQTTYQGVNRLMDAAVFAIGIYENIRDRDALYFPSFIERGEVLKPSYEYLDQTLLSSHCFNHQETIFIRNLQQEYTRYLLELTTPTIGEQPASIIYLPLVYEGRKLGVLTVQSFRENAYTDYDLEVLRNLEAYLSNAIDNAQAHATIERKNQEVMASISYAQRIQAAILPHEDEIRRLLPNSFVFFKPRDVVSGDFYWLAEVDEKVIVAAVDCTGHGVPGAFMSMIGETLLSEIIKNERITSPSRILSELDLRIQDNLRQAETNNQDGMDMALCTIDRKGGKLYFAGAKNPLVCVQEGELRVIKGDRQGIGGSQRMKRGGYTFEEHSLELSALSYCYLFSDGYQDQFGGPRNRKFKPKKLYQLLHQIHTESPKAQHQHLDESLQKWQGREQQIDDILVLGFAPS